MTTYLKSFGNKEVKLFQMEMRQVEICQDGKTIIQPRKKGKVGKKRKYKRKKIQ